MTVLLPAQENLKVLWLVSLQNVCRVVALWRQYHLFERQVILTIVSSYSSIILNNCTHTVDHLLIVPSPLILFKTRKILTASTGQLDTIHGVHHLRPLRPGPPLQLAHFPLAYNNTVNPSRHCSRPINPFYDGSLQCLSPKIHHTTSPPMPHAHLLRVRVVSCSAHRKPDRCGRELRIAHYSRSNFIRVIQPLSFQNTSLVGARIILEPLGRLTNPVIGSILPWRRG
jgi:hypothetical protein